MKKNFYSKEPRCSMRGALGFLALQATKGEMDDGAYLFPYKFGGSNAKMLLE
jgi:hypothetical protein